MKSGQYRISEKAIQDLDEIWEYTQSEWSENQADRYYFSILEGIEKVATQPHRGIQIDHLREGYRRISIGNHLIFYRKAADGMIEVVRILHQRMDLEAHFE